MRARRGRLAGSRRATIVGKSIMLASGLLAALGMVAISGVGALTAETSPSKSFRGDLASILVFAMPLGLGCGIWKGPAAGFLSAIVAGLAYSLTCSQGVGVILSGLILRARGVGPVRVLRSFESARRHHSLRQSGRSYPFRHATLQELVAGEGGRCWDALQQNLGDAAFRIDRIRPRA